MPQPEVSLHCHLSSTVPLLQYSPIRLGWPVRNPQGPSWLPSPGLGTPQSLSVASGYWAQFSLFPWQVLGTMSYPHRPLWTLNCSSSLVASPCLLLRWLTALQLFFSGRPLEFHRESRCHGCAPGQNYEQYSLFVISTIRLQHLNRQSGSLHSETLPWN